ncbi:hypothetical protein EMCRGX_G005270 [Ephydatia muelleri]
MSPLLFNIALEGLLRHLASCNYGYRLRGLSIINHLAYADDVCVIAGSKQQGQALLDRCVEFTMWAGLTFNPQKCGSLCAVNNVSPMYIDPNPLHPGPDNIPALSWHQRYKYLGCPIGAGSSLDLSAIGGPLLRDCEAIMMSQLAEWQKIDAFRRFPFPRLSYAFKVFFPGSSWCRKLDTSMRKWIKKGVSLPARACSSFIYTPQALGGLGIPRCEDEMHIARAAQAFNFLADTRDPIPSGLLLSNNSKAYPNSPYVSHLQGGPGCLPQHTCSIPGRSQGRRKESLEFNSASIVSNGSEISWHKRDRINQSLGRHLTELLQAPDQGRASFSTCLAAASNYFTYSGAYLTFAQYRFALRAHLSLLPTRTVQARSGKVLPDTRCRHCHQVPETLSHITNHCLHNMGLIRERHNAVLERLIRAIPSSMGDKFKEQPLPNTTGANHPDLTVVAPDGRSALLVDECIPFEGSPEALQEAAQEKLRKYEPLRQSLLGRFERVEVLPFIVGSLGSWFPPNDEVLHSLHIGRKYAVLMRRLCVASAISGSQTIWYRSTCSHPGTNIPSHLPLPDVPPPSPNLSHSQLLRLN